MGTKSETSLQQRIQDLIEARGGYVNKNWGNMISEPGIADLTVCYKGLYLAIETKVDDNKPTKAQGIHARNVQKANGITAVVWSKEEVRQLLDEIDKYHDEILYPTPNITRAIQTRLDFADIDDGTRY